MSDWSFEPTIGEMLREPMVRALMKADRVDVPRLEARLNLMAAAGAGSEAEAAEDADADVAGWRPFAATMRLPVAAAERCCRC